MLTNQTRGALVQLLQAISPDAVRVLFLKHLDIDRPYYDTNALLQVASSAAPEQMTGVLIELLTGNTAIRSYAPGKRVFDTRRDELARRLRADGFEVIEDALTRLVPAAEPVAQIVDHLDQSLSSCDLDYDEEIRRLLRESHSNISAATPDFNGATTKARIALETVARRAASRVATKRNKPAPLDTWGPALSFLRTEGVITQADEEAISKMYTFISPGAHLPKGLSHEQWALLARTFAISSTYFLTHQYVVA